MQTNILIPLMVIVFLERLSSNKATALKRPNIVIILADELGINDVSFQGSNQILTPNIDALAYNGIILSRHYVGHSSSLSQASLFTGKFNVITGMTDLVNQNGQPWGLMPEFFRDANYAIHLIGKWHIGSHRLVDTPLYRGFQTHTGCYSRYNDPSLDLSHIADMYSSGLDLSQQLESWPETNGTYASDLLTDAAIAVIQKHNHRQPLFLTIAHLSPHTGNQIHLLQAPVDEVDRQKHIADPQRRIYAAMLAKLDQSVARIVAALAMKYLLDNTIILFSSGNGEPTTTGLLSNIGSNAPLRGMKNSAWESAIRTAGILWSPLLKQRGYVSQQPIHIVDWLPTLASVARVPLPRDLKLDGRDMWSVLNTNGPIQSRRLMLAVELNHFSAYLRGNLKYVSGSSEDGNIWQGHIPSHEKDPRWLTYESEILESQVNRILGRRYHSLASIRRLRFKARIRCPKFMMEYDPELYACHLQVAPCFFDVVSDPCEQYNLANIFPNILRSLQRDVDKYIRFKIPALHYGTWQ